MGDQLDWFRLDNIFILTTSELSCPFGLYGRINYSLLVREH